MRVRAPYGNSWLFVVVLIAVCMFGFGVNSGAEEVMLEEDFSENAIPAGWEMIQSPNWYVQDGTLRIAYTEIGGLVLPLVPQDSFAIEFDVKITRKGQVDKWSCWAGVEVYKPNRQSLLPSSKFLIRAFDIEDNIQGVALNTEGGTVQSAGGVIPDYPGDKFNRIRVEVRKNVITVFLNGELFFEYESPNRLLAPGYICLWSHWVESEFDNVKVTKL